jgi:carbazole 1,9a-dioxygenase terminal dioxygenase component
VPLDEQSHHYMVTWGKQVSSVEEAERFDAEVDTCWKDLFCNRFASQDVMAREAMEPFYGSEGGWDREVLLRPDMQVIAWRQVASDFNRGIQKRRTGKASAGRAPEGRP